MWSLKQAEDKLKTNYLDNVYPFIDSAPKAILWFQSKNRFSKSSDYIPIKGDIMFFDTNLDGNGDHTAMVIDTEVKNGTTYIITIEGNIPGDKVKQIRSRTIELNNKFILGYGRYK